MIPDQQIVLGPAVDVAEARLELEGEQIVQHLVAFALWQLVDACRVARVGIQHFAAGDRMREEQRMHHRSAPTPLFIGHRRTLAGMVLPHVLPELLEVVGGGASGEARPDLIRQRVIDGVHVGELGAAEWRAVAARNADTVEHVHEAHHVTVRHVGVPVLAGIRRADVFAALLHVRQDTDMGGVALGDAGALDVAEPLGEAAQVTHIELLVGKPQHAVPAECQQDARELLLIKPPDVDAVHSRAKDRASGFDGQHGWSPEGRTDYTPVPLSLRRAQGFRT